MVRPDVVVIGAGAAGLAAACTLSHAGCAVVVLEARDRIGGRAWTRRATAIDMPVELGAEFIHGHAPATFSRLAAAGMPAVDAAGEHCTLEGGAFVASDDRFGELQRAMQSGRGLDQADMSFADYLDTLSVSDATRAFARTLVEGYDAADPAQASAGAIVEEWAGSAAADAPTFRPVQGYAPLLEAMARQARSHGADLRLDSIVQSVAWSAQGTSVAASRHGREFELDARCIVVTLPLGVLQAPSQDGGVRFSPALDMKRAALDALAAGPVSKVVLEFRGRWWEALEGGAALGFLHAAAARYPTWWTQLPLRAPLLTAWAGGPRVGSLADPAGQALDDLRVLFGSAVVDDQFVAAHTHDWQADPYACGAYSYVKTGGGEARARLAEPVGDVLYFAGEAADTEGEAGTLAGALQSGERAARAILARMYDRQAAGSGKGPEREESA